MKEKLVGNFLRGNLLGGVISAVLDATGGIIATAEWISLPCIQQGRFSIDSNNPII
ncbi:MAG: hypothetical protein ACQERN_11695 [Thermodesulfobacteriota bacterium]